MESNDEPTDALASALLAGEFGLALDRLRGAQGPPDPSLVQVAAGALVRSITDGDTGTLQFALVALMSEEPYASPELRGVLVALQAVAAAAAEPSGTSPLELEPGSMMARMLAALLAEPELTNNELCDRLGTDPTQLSRAGRKLIDGGLARRQKRGRTNRWTVTSLGRAAASAAAVAGGQAPAHAAAVLRRLRVATDAREIAELAQTLTRVGLAERRSANTRGSLVIAAPHRLPTEVEADLLSVLDRAPAAQPDVLAALGEWGSAVSAHTLSMRIGEPFEVDVIRSLRRLGGVDASLAIAEALRGVLADPAPNVDSVAETIAALTELASGGRTDMTERGPQPARTARWQTDDRTAALRTVDTVRRVLRDAAGHPGLTPYLRQRSALSAGQVLEWGLENSIVGGPAGVERIAIGDGGTATVDVASLEVFSVDGRLSSLDIDGRPGSSDATAAATAVGHVAAAKLAQAETEDEMALALLELQVAAAINSRVLESVVSDAVRRSTAEAATTALERSLARDGALELFGAALSRFRDGDRVPQVEAVEVVGLVKRAAREFGTDGVERGEAAADAFEASLRTIDSDRVPTPAKVRDRSITVATAQGLARDAAIASRRGARSSGRWLLAAEAWSDLDPEHAARARLLAVDPGSLLWTWDSIVSED